MSHDVIARCTRAGVTSWSNVARQLGRSVDSVRSEFDPEYLRVRMWPHVCEVVEPEPEVDENDTRSPYPKSVGMRARILALLERQMMSVEALSGFLQSPVNSVRARLDRMLDAQLVFHDGCYPRSWGLLEVGGQRRIYGASELSTHVPAHIDNDQRAVLKGIRVEMRGGQKRNWVRS